jgi:IMP dehydrogenase/GMP reductase
MNDKLLEFSDVLIQPVFSNVRSRKDVDVSTDFLGLKLALPVLNSNMDTVASPELCRALAEYGTIGTLHRFWSIEENVKAFVDSISPEGKGIGPIVSIGIGDKEFERAKALYKVGASKFMLDVAHAANIAVVEMYNKLVKEFPCSRFIVGDFGTGAEILEFLKRVDQTPDAFKVGIGIGSVCHTKLVTGVGNTSLSCLFDCAEALEGLDTKLILDGGVVHYGDISKALVAGADIVISGSMFAGTDEAAGEVIGSGCRKVYRGSASLPSYKVQGKEAPWRAPEGTSITVDMKGPVIDILNNINGALRSSCSYVNAFNLDQLKANAKFQFLK